MFRIYKTIGAVIMEFEELSENIREMFYLAAEVRKNAQAPLSHYLAGACVRSAKTGQTYTGCNVERCSYTQTTHAEQSAVDSLVKIEGIGAKLSELVFVAGMETTEIILPPIVTRKRHTSEDVNFAEIPMSCGHCLQCIWENCLGDEKVSIFSILPTGQIAMVTIGSAYPLKFGPEDIGIKYGG